MSDFTITKRADVDMSETHKKVNHESSSIENEKVLVS